MKTLKNDCNCEECEELSFVQDARILFYVLMAVFIFGGFLAALLK